MASTAALMTGLQSFDSSDAGMESRAAGHTTQGGITFVSVADSFHSEDFDQPGEWQGSAGINVDARKNKENEVGEVDYGSLLEEEEVRADSAGANFGVDEEGDDELLDDPYVRPPTSRVTHKAQSAARRPTSALSGTTRTTSAASQSSRIPSTSTAPTESPQPAHAPPATAILDLGFNNSRADGSDSIAEDSARLLHDLNPNESSRDDESLAIGKYGASKKSKGSEKGLGQHMTLREQEKVIDQFKKENFDLKLKIHFYEQRLESLAPEQIDQALRENIQLKVEFATLRTELKRYKKLLLEGNKAIETLTRERDSALKQGAGKDEREKRRREEKEKADREILEHRLREQAKELKEMRDMLRRRGSEFEGEDGRAEIFRLRAELDDEREARELLLGEADDLRRELRDARDMLEDAQDDVALLKQGGNGRDDTLASVDSSRRGGKREVERLERRVGDLEQDNTTLRSQVTAQVTMLSARNAEKDALRDEVELLKGDIVHLENELDHHNKLRSRSERSLDSNGEDKTREQLEQENDEYRDRATAHALQIEALENQLDEKEKEIEELLGDLDNRDADHAHAINRVDEEWKAEVEDARARAAEARDILEEKEADTEELAEKLEELVRQLEEKEAALAAETQEVEALTDDLGKLGSQNNTLEAESDEKDDRIRELETELNGIDQDFEEKQALHNQVVDALKEKLSTTKARASEIGIQHESIVTENKFLHEKVEELALHTAELEEKARADNEARRRLEDEVEQVMLALRKEEEERDLDQQEWSRQRQEEEAKWQRVFDGKDKDLKHAEAEAGQIKNLVAIREADVQKLQDTLNGLESESRRLGESHTNNRFALELELERLKRDLTRYESDLKRERAASEQKDALLKERDLNLATVRSEKNDLATQLASQTQTRLNVTDRFDSTNSTLRDTQAQLAAARERLSIVESELKSDRRSLNESEHQYRDQLSDRNTLLLTIYQYLDKVAGDKSPRAPGYTEPKPFNNFKVFHDSLMKRVKNVDMLQSSFERRSKEIESKFTDQFAALKRQQEMRFRQLDRFEGTIKTATDTQRQWRQRVTSKQIELDTSKSTNAELQTQIASLRQRANVAGVDPGTSAKISVLSTRASTAERRLAATQAQLASAEEKLGEARTKVGVAEGKWEARLRELEARLHAAEEKVKRERQGAKERVAELSETIKNLQGQVVGAKRRDHQLGEVLEAQDARTA